MKVIGLTGTIGSGKNLIKNILMEKLDAGCITLSDVIKREAKNEGLDRKKLAPAGRETGSSFKLFQGKLSCPSSA